MIITTSFTRQKKSLHHMMLLKLKRFLHLVFFVVNVHPVSPRRLEHSDNYPLRLYKHFALLGDDLFVQLRDCASVVLPLDTMDFDIQRHWLELSFNLVFINTFQRYVNLERR